jgi:hypothetical protein
MSRAGALALLALVGACSGRGASADEQRIAAWRADLETFATELPARHVDLFFRTGEQDFRRAVTELEGRLGSLRHNEVAVGVMRLAAMIGDGHTTAWLESPAARFRYPVRLFVFAEGVFVVDAADEHAWARGGRVVAVHGRPLDEVLASLAEVISHDNRGALDAALADRLTSPLILDGLGLAGPDATATFRIALPDGSQRDLALGPAAWQPRPETGDGVPLHRRNHHLKYWNDYVAADRMVYLQYNACKNDPGLPFATFAANTLAFLDQNPVDTVVIDLRYNTGGDSAILRPMIEGLRAREVAVYAIIGRHTFSSALLNAMELDRDAGAVLVGEPTGGSPSHYGQVASFELPALGLRVQYSTKRFEFPQYEGDALAPELPAPPTAADQFAGRDAALEAIRAHRRELP